MSNTDLVHDLTKLLRIREIFGHYYGTEDLCVFLYALIKQERPRLVVELGTGLGVTMLWMAQAIRENGEGHVYTLDNASQGESCLKIINSHIATGGDVHGADSFNDYSSYINSIIAECDLTDFITPVAATFTPDSLNLLKADLPIFTNKTIDLLFSDFRDHPKTIMGVLIYFLPLMSDYSSIFIDGVSTNPVSFLMLERTVAQLNQGKIPDDFLRAEPDNRRRALIELVARRQFRLMHLVEKKARRQNSTAWLRIEPVDWRPYPDAFMR